MACYRCFQFDPQPLLTQMLRILLSREDTRARFVPIRRVRMSLSQLAPEPFLRTNMAPVANRTNYVGHRVLLKLGNKPEQANTFLKNAFHSDIRSDTCLLLFSNESFRLGFQWATPRNRHRSCVGASMSHEQSWKYVSCDTACLALPMYLG